jgi:hypothetical protein
MPVLEVLQLKVKPTINPTNSSILTSLQTVRSLLASKIHPTQSRFYQSIEDPSLIFVLGIWDSLSQHQAFLSSPFRVEVLSPQEDLLDFSWCVHIPIVKREDLPLEAPIVSVARIKLKSGEHVPLHKEITGRYREVLEETTKPFGVVEGWILDGREEGKREQVVITGWPGKEEHLAFSAGLRERFEDYRGLRGHWESVMASHMRDMEK